MSVGRCFGVGQTRLVEEACDAARLWFFSSILQPPIQVEEHGCGLRAKHLPLVLAGLESVGEVSRGTHGLLARVAHFQGFFRCQRVIGCGCPAARCGGVGGRGGEEL
jgi:hypothetical protein